MEQFPSDSPFEPRTLVEKTAYIRKNSIIALVLALFSFLFCGFIGFYSFSLAGSVIETIDYYNICRERRPLGVAAKIISIVAAIWWVLAVILYVLTKPKMPWKTY